MSHDEHFVEFFSDACPSPAPSFSWAPLQGPCSPAVLSLFSLHFAAGILTPLCGVRQLGLRLFPIAVAHDGRGSGPTPKVLQHCT